MFSKNKKMLLSQSALGDLVYYDYDYKIRNTEIEIFYAERGKDKKYRRNIWITWLVILYFCSFFYFSQKNFQTIVLFILIGSLVSLYFYAINRSVNKYFLLITPTFIKVQLPLKKATIFYSEIKRIRLDAEDYDFNKRGSGGKGSLYSSIYCEYRNKEILLINFSGKSYNGTSEYADLFRDE
ncbi:MAG: hypothetical protein J7604_26130, partial [Sporocytophaga sp.]|uniref:hypothetical protein n=1 Tax=Sporocytophaga sp. TaxID=2231183 RepID=UPI001B061F07